MVKERLRLALSRARYAAMGAAAGAALGGLFSRNAASSGAAAGALVGAFVGERRLDAETKLDELRSAGEQRLEAFKPGRKVEAE